MIRNDQECSAASHKLAAYRDLLENPAWQEEIAPKIKAGVAISIDGLSCIGRTPQERSEHLHAYHLFRELSDLIPKKMAALEKDLRAYSEKQPVMGIRASDAIA